MKNSDRLGKVLARLKIEALNPMQEAAHSAILKERDILLLAPTGSGKTLAYLLPVLEMLKPIVEGVQCLVIAPSRELALQIEQVWRNMSTGFKVNCCYGGHSILTERKNLTEPPALLIGTPGRIVDHMLRKTFTTNNIRTLVLDEFDKSLTLGFQVDISEIIQNLRNLEKKVLVSATPALEIPDFTGVKDPKVLNFTVQQKAAGLQIKLVHSSGDKIDSLADLLSYLGGDHTIIFCNHREVAQQLGKSLKERGIDNAVFQGKMDQDERERTLVKFRNGSINFLVATDLAARGLDIPEVRNVVHFQLPHTQEEFIHRNGRTARMMATGTAYVISHEGEKRQPYLGEPEELVLNGKYPLPPAPQWTTLYFAAGRKNKINKIDIVGFLSQKGKLDRDELGMIEVKDFMSFAAVKSSKAKEVLRNIAGEKIKGRSVKIDLAR